MESLIEKVIDEVKDRNEPKNLPLDKFFSTFCALKGLDERHPTARTCKTEFNQFFKFLEENNLEVRNLNELDPIMMSKFVRYLKGRQSFSRKLGK